MVGLNDADKKALRSDFELFVNTWHESLSSELSTWNDHWVFYTNLELNNLFRAYCCGALGIYKNKGN